MAETASCRRELLIEVPVEEVRSAVERVTQTLQKRARIPGFRPGKTPVNLVRQRFSDDIRHEVLHHLIPEHFHRRVQEQKLAPVSEPDFADVKFDLEGNEPLRFKATFEVVPEFELKDYSGLEVEVEDATVTDEEAEAELKALQEQQAVYEPLEDRPLDDGDFALISMRGKAAGETRPAVKVDNIYCEIGGADTLPAFTENLRGAAPGEERTFEVSYPQDYTDQRLAGRTIEYTATINSVNRKEIPELNDEFAKDLGNFQSLEEVRADIRRRLFEDKRHHAETAAKDRLLERLAEMHPFDVPQSLVESQLKTRMERTVRRLAQQGVDPSKLDVDWTRVRASQRDGALRDVKASLVLERIAERESVEVSEQELEHELDELAHSVRGKDPAAVRARLTREGVADRIKNRLRTDKTLALVYRQAKKVLTTGRAEPAAR